MSQSSFGGQDSTRLLGGTAGDAEEAVIAWMGPGKAKVGAARFTNDAAVTANDTNNAVLTVTSDGTSLGSLTTSTSGTGSLAANTTTAFSLSGAGSALLDPGDQVKLAKTINGTGVDIPGTFHVRFDRVRAD